MKPNDDSNVQTVSWLLPDNTGAIIGLVGQKTQYKIQPNNTTGKMVYQVQIVISEEDLGEDYEGEPIWSSEPEDIVNVEESQKMPTDINAGVDTEDETYPLWLTPNAVAVHRGEGLGLAKIVSNNHARTGHWRPAES